MENSNLRLFWILNIAFWLTYYISQGTTSPVFLSIALDSRCILILSFLFWISLITGTYRFIYQKLRVWEKPLQYIIVQSIFAIVVMAFLDLMFRFNLNVHFFQLIGYSLKSSNIYPEGFSEKSQFSVLFNHMSWNGQVTKLMAYSIWVIAFNFYRYSAVAKGALVEKFKVENQLKDAELINLRSQLNPHFLFNSLNSIHSMALTQNENTSDAVLLLSDLMRYTLNYEKKDLVTVEEEMETVMKYIALEQIRFGKRLRFSQDIDVATLGMKIPPIIIQTLAENAIKHSISRNTEGGDIFIKTHAADGFLYIEIRNTGQLKAPLNDEGKPTGIGVDNTQKRLKMIFGEKSNLKLENASSEEVLATLKIPHG
jgi:two-component system, LytTR family, sensor kinase